MEKIILASGSPRRQELLQQIGVPFEVVKSEAEELKKLPRGKNAPRKLVEENAKRKANDVFQKHPDRIVLAADTIVYFNGKIYGKPKDEEDAKEMLRELSGQTHLVYTGVALTWLAPRKTDAAFLMTGSRATSVTFKKLSEQEIVEYVATGEPLDKAGAYAIQGKAAIFVDLIEGSFSNVVGLPLRETGDMLQRAGVKIL